MTEIIVLTREQYFEDLNKAATIAAEHVYNRFTKTNRKELVTRAEASKLLSISKATIKNMIDQQRIRTTTDGKFIPITEIDKYLNGV